MRLKRWRLAIHHAVQRLLRAQSTTYADGRIDEYRTYWQEAASRLSADFSALGDSVWEVRLNGRRTRLLNYLAQIDDPVTLELGGDKVFGYQVAQAAGVPIPEHVALPAARVDLALGHMSRCQGPLVIKPGSGSSAGMGVTTNVRTPAQVLEAWALASLYASTIIVERMIFGESCRLLYLDGNLIHAVRRRGLRFRGDGRSTIAELLVTNGQARLRDDSIVAATLAAQGLTVGSIVPAGDDCVVSTIPVAHRGQQELRTVYNESITSSIGSDLLDEGRRVVSGLGSAFAGVDVVTNDPSRSLEASGGAFLEVNTTPGLHHHYLAPEDFGDNSVAVQVLRHLLSPPTNGSRTTIAGRP